MTVATLSLERCPALVLNADYQPLSYFPLSLWNWQTVVKAVFLDRVNIVSEYDRVIRSPSFEMRLPSVIALKKYIKPSRHPAFTRFNLFLRDRFTCQYCGTDQDNGTELTFDHVVPRAYGGRTTWENVITACAPCNLTKGGRTPEEARLPLRSAPRQPSVNELQRNGRAFPPNYLHESWRDYLYWDAELEA
ncbi:MAG: HNH endonuclease [Sphingomonadales bacterium]